MLSAAVRRRPDTFAAATAVAAAAGMLGWFLWAMQRRTGAPGSVLDDAYIHFDYATQLARGYFFNWLPGHGYSTGATSILWPILLAPAHWFGLREERMAIWAAILGAVLLAISVWLTYR